jgi:transposase InsO family protein
VNYEVFKEELDRLVEIGVLCRVSGLSPFAAPTFIIPKKDGKVRWVSDFRELNKIIKRRVYPVPKINEILRKRSGYDYFTKLDISMQFYTFELDKESQDLCIISTPFGCYKYLRAPMGVKQTPDFAQQVMEEVLRDMPEVEVYFDDVGIFTKGSYELHLEVVSKVLDRLQSNNFTVNPLKCEWAVKETDWLGFWLTPNGLKPWKKKIQAILNMDRPRNVSQVRSFIGAVTFYREMFPKRSHILTPLHNLTATKGNQKFNWTPECQQSFDTIKAILAKDIFIRYPDHSKPFHVYTDASDTQLGSVIIQEGKPVAYFSRKLNPAQCNYTVMEKELLSIVTTLSEYRTMLYGVKELHVYTDHKNLTYSNLNSQRVIRWRLFLEEFNPIFHYIKGTDNTLADALSQLPFKEGQGGVQSKDTHTTEKPPLLVPRTATADSEDSMHATVSGTPEQKHSYSILVDDEDMLECFLNFPDVTPATPFALDFNEIATAQQEDESLAQLRQNDPTHYKLQAVVPGGTPVVVHQADANDRPRVVIPDSMLDNLIHFYHMVTVHAGTTRTHDTIRENFTHSKLRSRVRQIIERCDSCQRAKLPGRGYGHHPPREATVAPWQEVAVDLIGPWTIVDEQGEQHKFTAITIVDNVTTYCEIQVMRNKTAAHAGWQLENQWLARYPMPSRCIFDQGNEFLGEGFQAVLRRHHIKPVPATVKNPQANAVCERLHQSVGNTLRAFNRERPPRDQEEAEARIVSALQTAAYAARVSMHTTMKLSPGAMAFHRDMLLNIPVIVDFELLRQRRQALIDKNLQRANEKRYSYDYQPGQQVLKLVYDPKKLDDRAFGPFPIERVHVNGTVVIRTAPDVTERINIRRIKPYKQ